MGVFHGAQTEICPGTSLSSASTARRSVAVVVVASVVFPSSGSISPESGVDADVPNVCGFSIKVLLLLFSVGRRDNRSCG